MSRFLIALTTGVSVMGLAACSNPAPDAADTAAPEAEAVETIENNTEAPVEAAPDYSDLNIVMAGEWRGERGERDSARNPAATLEFFEIDPSGTIIEIWPGGGWYADILAPWINANGGTFVAAHFPESTPSEYRQRSRAAFAERYADENVFGSVQIAGFDDTTDAIVEPGSADAVLTFRNVHNWMMNGFAEKAFADFHAALRPGGVLGVVEHRLPSTREQDPQAGSGYVQEAYVIALAEEAGFEFVGASEINANPADTADHPFGVWTLPPVRRDAARGEEPAADWDRTRFDEIGESDRMTLLFRKPESAE